MPNGVPANPPNGVPGNMPANMPGNMPGGMPANPNEPGLDGAGAGPGNFRTPYAAAATFLAALRSKDPDRLADAVALRAPIEASLKYQKVFKAILERSLAPEDLDELAKKFEGMQIISHNPPKSTNTFEIIVGGVKGTSQFHRTITMRKEKAGWKAFDVSGAREFEKQITLPRTRPGGNIGQRPR